MMKTFAVSLGMAFWCCNITSALADVPTGATGREYMETVLLLSDADFDVRLGLVSLRGQKVKSKPMHDLVAELLWSACSGKRRMQPDTLAWAAKTLSRTEQGRYAGVIDQCLEKVTDKTAVKYLVMAKDALAGKPAPDPFIGGRIDLTQVGDQVRKNRKANPPPEAMKTGFAGVRSEQRLEDVYGSLGAPDSIRGERVSRGKVGFIVRVRVGNNRVVFDYDKQGDITFGFDDSTGDWLLIDARSDNDLIWLSQKRGFGTQIDTIVSGDAQEMYQLIKRLKKQTGPIDPALLDRIADRIYYSQMESDGEMPDVLAHMCKLLAKTNNGKYKPVLLEVAEKAGHRGVRKHAQVSADALPDPGADKYIPKAISN